MKYKVFECWFCKEIMSNASTTGENILIYNIGDRQIIEVRISLSVGLRLDKMQGVK